MTRRQGRPPRAALVVARESPVGGHHLAIALDGLAKKVDAIAMAIDAD